MSIHTSIHVEPNAPDRAIMLLMSRVVDALTAVAQGETSAQGPVKLISVTAEAAIPGDLCRLAVERVVEVEEQYGMTLAGWEHGGFVRTETTLRTWGYVAATQESANLHASQVDITDVGVEEMTDPERWRIAFEAVIVSRVLR